VKTAASTGLVIGLSAVLGGLAGIPTLALIPLSMLVFGLLGVALGKLLPWTLLR
jgi:ABC-type nitrate/sulfonate/bicarbonate transport system permease component